MGDKSGLGAFEFATMSALIALKENAYGMRIREHLDALLGRPIAIGAVYTTLARLEEKRLISSFVGKPTPERGGRSKRYYTLEAAGQTAFEATIAEQDRLRRFLPSGPLPV